MECLFFLIFGATLASNSKPNEYDHKYSQRDEVSGDVYIAPGHPGSLRNITVVMPSYLVDSEFGLQTLEEFSNRLFLSIYDNRSPSLERVPEVEVHLELGWEVDFVEGNFVCHYAHGMTATWKNSAAMLAVEYRPSINHSAIYLDWMMFFRRLSPSQAAGLCYSSEIKWNECCFYAFEEYPRGGIGNSACWDRNSDFELCCPWPTVRKAELDHMGCSVSLFFHVWEAIKVAWLVCLRNYIKAREEFDFTSDKNCVEAVNSVPSLERKCSIGIVTVSMFTRILGGIYLGDSSRLVDVKPVPSNVTVGYISETCLDMGDDPYGGCASNFSCTRAKQEDIHRLATCLLCLVVCGRWSNLVLSQWFEISLTTLQEGYRKVATSLETATDSHLGAQQGRVTETVTWIIAYSISQNANYPRLLDAFQTVMLLEFAWEHPIYSLLKLGPFLYIFMDRQSPFDTHQWWVSRLNLEEFDGRMSSEHRAWATWYRDVDSYCWHEELLFRLLVTTPFPPLLMVAVCAGQLMWDSSLLDAARTFAREGPWGLVIDKALNAAPPSRSPRSSPLDTLTVVKQRSRIQSVERVSMMDTFDFILKGGSVIRSGDGELLLMNEESTGPMKRSWHYTYLMQQFLALNDYDPLKPSSEGPSLGSEFCETLLIGGPDLSSNDVEFPWGFHTDFWEKFSFWFRRSYDKYLPQRHPRMAYFYNYPPAASNSFSMYHYYALWEEAFANKSIFVISPSPTQLAGQGQEASIDMWPFRRARSINTIKEGLLPYKPVDPYKYYQILERVVKEIPVNAEVLLVCWGPMSRPLVADLACNDHLGLRTRQSFDIGSLLQTNTMALGNISVPSSEVLRLTMQYMDLDLYSEGPHSPFGEDPAHSFSD